MIVGTAGHIDHGKTALVTALTGMDTDRLPEEKKRGISIELGYAFLETPHGERIGFIDVPGHERLVRTMLAGAIGIDFALLVVAADDGVMPQTREHLAVLSLLGLSRGAVAITKTDRAGASRVAEVANDTATLLAGTSLDGAPIVPTSVLRGDGPARLAALLSDAARDTSRLVDDGEAFRLAVDRAFSLDGIGTVATGTVHAGCVREGDELVVLPAARRVRVRSVHAQNQSVDRARAGQRCAVALAGVSRDALGRGDWLASPEAALTTDRIDTTLSLWRDEPRPLRSGTPVHVHLGAAALQGSVAVLDGDSLAPGHSARVQIVLRTPTAAWRGDRIVLRDASATRTIAGGRVLDPFAPARFRRTPQRLAELDALAREDPTSRAAALLAVSPQGIDWSRYIAGQGKDVAIPPDAVVGNGRAMSVSHARAARAALLAALSDFHLQHPLELGPDSARLRRLALPRLPDALFRTLLADLRAEGAISVKGARVQLPSHGVSLSAGEKRISQSIAPRLRQAGFEGAWVRDLARDAGEPEASMRAALCRLAQAGELHQVVKDLFYPPAALHELAAIARNLAARHAGEVKAAQYRDATRLGRNRTIQVLEYFDRAGLLRRVGHVHRLRSDCSLFGPEADRS